MAVIPGAYECVHLDLAALACWEPSYCSSEGQYLDILLLQQGTPGSSATLSPTCLLVTPGPHSMMSLQWH